MKSMISTQDMATTIKQLLRCQRCGGQVLLLSDDIGCLQCGAPHTKEGEIVRPAASKN
jgi:ribosomal protein L37E